MSFGDALRDIGEAFIGISQAFTARDESEFERVNGMTRAEMDRRNREITARNDASDTAWLASDEEGFVPERESLLSDQRYAWKRGTGWE